ncbi:PLD nuclease N-terminal domain-containing protein [Desulfobacterales bacterium HSG17]|nr:PLD nuclease N-terminal domain-containing protein [Desulfobacterales bacterium HSG17]
MTQAQLIIIGIGTTCWILTCLALLDVAKKDFGGIEKKAAWGFVAFFPFLGFLIYFIFGARKGKRILKNTLPDQPNPNTPTSTSSIQKNN